MTPNPQPNLLEKVRRRQSINLLPPPADRKAIRAAARVSMRELADELGTTHGSIYYYERGGNPRPDLAARYAHLLAELAEAVGYTTADVQK